MHETREASVASCKRRALSGLSVTLSKRPSDSESASPGAPESTPSLELGPRAAWFQWGSLALLRGCGGGAGRCSGLDAASACSVDHGVINASAPPTKQMIEMTETNARRRGELVAGVLESDMSSPPEAGQRPRRGLSTEKAASGLPHTLASSTGSGARPQVRAPEVRPGPGLPAQNGVARATVVVLLEDADILGGALVVEPVSARIPAVHTPVLVVAAEVRVARGPVVVDAEIAGAGTTRADRITAPAAAPLMRCFAFEYMSVLPLWTNG